jgi:hypothetical protein
MGEEQPQGVTGNLEQLARARFGETLTPPELKLMRAAPSGNLIVCGPNLNDEDPNNDPSKADKEWGQEREIRAKVIRWLCVEEKAKHEVDPKGILVYGAKITGKIDLSFVIVPFPLLLAHCRLMEDADLFHAQLPVLNLSGSWVGAISADGLAVEGDVFLRDGFHAEGEVRLLGAEIGGLLDCQRGTFVNPSGCALSADGINVHGAVFLRKGFHAEGEVRLVGAQIGLYLECDRGTFINPSGMALSADRIDVQGEVFLRVGFRAEGEVRLLGAEVGGNLDCTDSTFTKLVAHTATVRGNFWWRSLKDAAAAKLDLRNASVGSIGDDEKSWPAKGNLLLDGFVYGRISGGPTDAENRLRWLARQDPFTPQSYRQLAKVLREAGDDQGARIVLHEMELVRRQQRDRGPFVRIWGWLLRWTIGYGYYPLRAFEWLLVLAILGTELFWFGSLAGVMVPTEKEAYQTYRCEGKPPPHYEDFSPFIYSVENSLPLVKLGQADKWQPDPHPEVAVACKQKSETGLGHQCAWTVFLLWFVRSQISAGWLLATLFLAGVTGIVRKE